MWTARALEVSSSTGFGFMRQAHAMTYGPFIHHHFLPYGMEPCNEATASGALSLTQSAEGYFKYISQLLA